MAIRLVDQLTPDHVGIMENGTLMLQLVSNFIAIKIQYPKILN